MNHILWWFKLMPMPTGHDFQEHTCSVYLPCCWHVGYLEKLIIVTGARIIQFQEEVEKWRPILDQVLSRSRGSSATDCLSHFYPEGERSKVKLKLSLIKNQLSLMLTSRGALICIVWRVDSSLSCFRRSHGVALFVLSTTVTRWPGLCIVNSASIVHVSWKQQA